MCSEYTSEYLCGGCRCCGSYHDNFEPLRMRIYNHQKQLSQEGASMVNMYSGPWPSWPLPWMHRSYRGCSPGTLTLVTWLHSLFQILINARPPDERSCELFHSGHPWVTFVQLINDLASTLWWDNDSIPPQKTSVLHTELVLPPCIGLQHIVCRTFPTRLHLLKYCGEDLVTCSPLTNVWHCYWSSFQCVHEQNCVT